LLSAVVFELFMLPCVSLIGMLDDVTGGQGAQGRFVQASLLYALQMGLAGALAGGIGSTAGWLKDRRPPGEKPPDSPEKQA
jgi:hypothetical protein